MIIRSSASAVVCFSMIWCARLHASAGRPESSTASPSVRVAGPYSRTRPPSSRRATLLAGGRRRLAVLLAAVAALLCAGVVISAPANATIISPSNFYAECSPSSITTYSPDMRYWPNYGVSWNTTLYVWTSSGWSRYASSATQTVYGQNLVPAFSAWQPQQSATWSYLPRGRYYQARINAGWFGASSKLVTNTVVHHQTAQANFNQTVHQNSTSTYCYVP